jgi:hypothetical protein
VLTSKEHLISEIANIINTNQWYRVLSF